MGRNKWKVPYPKEFLMKPAEPTPVEEAPVPEATDLSWACTECGIVCVSERGLKLHTSKMHK